MEQPMFSVVKQEAARTGPRLGRLARAGCKATDTPCPIAATSRGCVPHLTPDNLARLTAINGVYTSLEDFIERTPRQIPPLCQAPRAPQGRMRSFIALPQAQLLIIGARRSPPIVAPSATSNTDSTVAVCTSVGFLHLEAETYTRYTEELDADIVLSLADVPHGRALGSKRIETATDRSIEWLQQHVEQRQSQQNADKAALFATLLPVPVHNQQYLVETIEQLRSQLDGLAIHSLSTLDDLSDSLRDLPRLGLTEPTTPLQVLSNIRAGIDILVVSFIDTATDAGMALDFAFGQSAPVSSETLPIAVDMWSTKHAVDVSPITQGCSCYACTTHHRAYTHHLLNAKEMLGWVLLQIHNHHIVNQFFQQIRTSILNGTLEADIEAFQRQYEPDFPTKTGQGPRVRGYQRKTEGRSESKANQAAFVKYEAALAGKALAARKSHHSPSQPSVDILATDFDLNLLAEQDLLDVKDQPDLSGDKATLQDGPLV